MDIEKAYIKLTKPQRSMVVALAERYEWQAAPYLFGNRAVDGTVCSRLADKGVIKRKKFRGGFLYMVTPLCLDLAEFAKNGRLRIYGRPVSNWQPGPDHIQIVERAAEMFGITMGRLSARLRDEVTLDARTAAIIALHKRWPELSYARLGLCVQRKDHSTIIHALERGFSKIEREEWFREVVEELTEMEILPLAPPNNALAANCEKLREFWKRKDEDKKLRQEIEMRDDGRRLGEIANARYLSNKFLEALKKERLQMHFA